MQQRRSHNTFIAQAIITSKINPTILIPLIEDMVCLEKTNLEANTIINDEIAYLTNEQRIAQAQLLLSLLRMHGLAAEGCS